MRRWMMIMLWIATSVWTAVAQETSPSIPVGLSDPYLMFVPVGWRAESPNPFGFVEINGDNITLNVLDPIRLAQYIPVADDASPRQLLIDYSRFFYVETISRQQIELLTIGDNILALYRDPDFPALATYIVEFADHQFALAEVEAHDGMYDSTEEATVHAVLGTLSVSAAGAIRNDTVYDAITLPSGQYAVALPPTWTIEPSLVPGELFLVGDGIEIILFTPDNLAGYFAYPDDVDLVELAQIIESEFFQLDLGGIKVTQAQAGDRQMVAYGFRSLSNQLDTQALLVQLPDHGVAYFKAVAPQGTITSLLRERIRRIALSLEMATGDGSNVDAPIETMIIPNSGQWRIALRELTRLVCDGTVERLIPTTDEVRALFGDFDTIVADPDGDSITIASDGIVNLFQQGTLLRDNTPYYQITGTGLGYTLTPLDENRMTGRLNLIVPDEAGGECRIGVSLDLRYIE